MKKFLCVVLLFASTHMMAKSSQDELVISHFSGRGVRAFSLHRSLLNDSDYILKKLNNRSQVSQRKISGHDYKKLLSKIRSIEKKRRKLKAKKSECEQSYEIAKPLEGIKKLICVKKGSNVDRVYSQLMFDLNMRMLN